MQHYLMWFNLKDSHKDAEFSRHAAAFSLVATRDRNEPRP